MWRCPKCESPLLKRENSLVCDVGHCFDIARQGYVNLLLANQKNSREPGDNIEMIDARSDFLRAGHYRNLVQRIQEMLLPHLPEKGCLLDLGCGEGYYLEQLALGIANWPHRELNLAGVDISKVAVRKAAVSAKTLPLPQSLSIQYAVASGARLPLMNGLVDLVVNVFAPVSPEELCRVMRDGGLLLRVTPGERHLYQLKAALYDTVRLHVPESPLSCFDLLQRENLKYSLVLQSAASLQQLIAMTPLNWRGKAEAKAALQSLDAFEVDVDFDIQLLGPVNTI